MLVQSPRARAYLELVRLANLFPGGGENVGCCRFLNVVLGASGAASLHPESWFWSVLPAALLVLLYISAVTLLATGEVWGGNRVISRLVFGALVVVIGGVVWLGVSDRLSDPLWAYLFLALFAAATLRVVGRVVAA